MSTGTLVNWPLQQPLDDSGLILSGALLYSYVAGTSTAVSLYADVGLTVPHTWPVSAGASGRFPELFQAPGTSIKLVLKTSAGVELWSADNIAAVPSTSAGVDVTGTAGEALPAGSAVYLSAGDGGKTAGLWYLASASNAYSSTTHEVGLVTSTILAGSSGTIRVSGEVPGLTGLIVGATYYVDTTPGALTTTVSNDARLLGQALTTTTMLLAPPLALTQGLDFLQIEAFSG